MAEITEKQTSRVAEEKDAGIDRHHTDLTQTSPTSPTHPARSPRPSPLSVLIEEWQTSGYMIGALLLAALLSLAHHLVYNSVADEPVESESQQTMYLRAGLVLNTAVSMLMGVVIGMTGTQVLWRLLTQKAFKVGTIDAMWGVVDDPFAVFDRELWRKAYLLLVVAVCMWYVSPSPSCPQRAPC
jgi:type III secretory pathway component EscT